ncbi:MAG: hypothetical protein FWH54_02365, partial [Methanobrevibacter sp.]|nr:hypothetical protein [Methanobrevibacter sp.]
IERYGKNKLKISLKIKDENHHIIPFDVYSRKFSNNKSVSYVKTNLNPKDYYFKFIRPKILKNVMREHSIESFYGLLKDSKRELYWYASIHVNDELISYKLTVSRRFSYHNGTYDKTIIEIFSKNKLKITYKVNKTTEVTYLNTKLLPRDYYDKVYRPEMIEMFDKSTIKHLPNDY